MRLDRRTVLAGLIGSTAIAPKAIARPSMHAPKGHADMGGDDRPKICADIEAGVARPGVTLRVCDRSRQD